MITMGTKSLHHIAVAGLVACLVLTAIFGVVLTMPMAAGGAMPMSHCLIMGSQAGLCPMSALDHLASWNNLFVAFPALLLVLGALVGVGAFPRVTNERTGAQRYKLRYYSGRGYIRKLFDPLLSGLAQGRLHPRFYA